MVSDRRSRWKCRILFLFLAVSIFALPAASNILPIVLFAPPSWDEVARVGAPDGTKDAVVFAWDGGATTDVGHHVFLVRRGQGVENGRESVWLYGAWTERIEGTDRGVGLHWKDNSTLTVTYTEAREAKLLRPTIFTRWGRAAVRAGDRGRVDVELVGGVRQHSGSPPVGNTAEP